jgi:hypothetical protein
MIWTLVCIVFILWLLGLITHLGGDLIHILLVLALIGVVYNLFVERGR